jgi:hypothetical protein
MKLLYKLLFGLLGYIILIIPHFIGIFIYPIWLILICALSSSIWFGPWLNKKYIQYKLRVNNPFRRK